MKTRKGFENIRQHKATKWKSTTPHGSGMTGKTYLRELKPLSAKYDMYALRDLAMLTRK